MTISTIVVAIIVAVTLSDCAVRAVVAMRCDGICKIVLDRDAKVDKI